MRKISFGKIIRLVDPEIRSMLAGDLYENENSTFYSCHDLLASEIEVLFLKLIIVLNLTFNGWQVNHGPE